jgi:peptide-methionine (S)-S-oxide reductase
MPRLVTGFAIGGLALALSSAAPAAGGGVAVFAGGCYWSMEHDMRPIKGVTSVVSGFVPYPADVPPDPGAHGARRFESVKVSYDPGRITYAQLAAAYLRMTDPTDPDGQFCDRGPAYRTAIFVRTDEERAEAQAAIAAAQPALKGRIVTRVLALTRFEPAEEDQQDWARKNAVAYANYRQGCGKDHAIKAIWGG